MPVRYKHIRWEPAGITAEVSKMSWERHDKRWYYYRSKRVNGRIVREYVGGGEKGRRAAAADQAVREAHRQAERQRTETMLPVHELFVHVRQFGSVLDQLLIAQLLADGWKHSYRHWRAPKRCY